MPEKHLHIVAFDIVFPANYGGAIDVFYRIKALHDAGVGIILHCTYKGQLTRYQELENLCEKVYYYKRDMSVLNQLSRLPYAVLTRKNDLLLHNLLQDDFPILFEGLVCCLYLDHPALRCRKKMFRECNVEHDYYRELAAATSSVWKKVYFRMDAAKLQRFEKVVQAADLIFALSHGDEQHFISCYPDVKVVYLPCFHPNSTVTSAVGKGDYVLYNGNLELAENEKAVLYLCKSVLPLMSDVMCVFAGRNPSETVKHAIAMTPNAELVENPSEIQMADLMRNAHVHLLVTHQSTGLKLKLLNSLYSGRFVVANSRMTDGTELRSLCHLADSAQGLAAECKRLMSECFTLNHIQERRDVLDKNFDNQVLCNRLLEYI